MFRFIKLEKDTTISHYKNLSGIGKGEVDLATGDAAFAENYSIASLYSLNGDKGKAIDYLNRAFNEGDPSLVSMKKTFYFDSLRDDQRFNELLIKIGLSE